MNAELLVMNEKKRIEKEMLNYELRIMNEKRKINDELIINVNADHSII